MVEPRCNAVTVVLSEGKGRLLLGLLDVEVVAEAVAVAVAAAAAAAAAAAEHRTGSPCF